MNPVRTTTCTPLRHPPSQNHTESISPSTISQQKRKIDTSAFLMIVSECTLHEQWPKLTVLPSQVKLHSYSGETIPVSGTVDLVVKYGDQIATLPLSVVKGEGPSLWAGIG